MAKRISLTGVNLGGWLIPEKWLTPSLFSGLEARDMYDLALLPEGKKRLEEHFEAFITEADFAWLMAHGVELVRIPVGYWLFEGDEPFQPAAHYLDLAMEWAKKHDIKVLIDLHAVKGSQNGEAHSGQVGEATWQKRLDYQEQTIRVLRQIAERYRNASAFWGLELVNEPKLDGSYLALLRFYRQAYQELQVVLPPGVLTVFHDAFHPLLLTGSLRAHKQHPVAIDVHWYALAPEVFGGLSLQWYLRVQKLWYGTLLRIIRSWQPVIIGEWSSVLPQAFFDRAPKTTHYDLLAQNIAAQQRLYKKAVAQIYWNYKAEGEGMWNFRSLVDGGTIRLDDYI